ncbi:hypothetical protein J2Y46_000967 [Microbacterium sp. BE35]|uniref:S8 family serine peptidase n=1 Tax=Microbacterium sp. BE35 TaxID=2817773 RepID=UPI00286307EB|nr:S8 family serine peptidase [Microbacterium sp. BE35]MDR7188151.1 hypothetical protein [Microbacterium sp. BE35]
MADHLRLPGLITLPTKRVNVQYDPKAAPRDRGHHATTLRGVLAGLESARAFPILDEDGALDPEEEWEVGELVIRFTGAQPFDNTAFKSLGLVPLAITDDKRYFALTDADARLALARLVGRYADPSDDLDEVANSLQKELAKIDGIDLYGQRDRLAPDLIAPDGDAVIDVDVALWPTSLERQNDARRGRERVQRLVEFIEAAAPGDPRVQVLAADDRDPDRLLIHARVDAVTLDALASHHLVERIRGPLHVLVTRQDLEALVLPADTLLPEGAAIGVIDDLVIETHPWLAGVVVEQRSFPDESTLGEPTRHGTQVAGVAAWGDVSALLDPGFDGQPHPLYVARIAQANDDFDAQVYGNPSDQFTAALDWLASHGIRVVVLALGESYADNGALTSDLSATIDEKAREHRMVIVTSAGNFHVSNAEELATYPSFLRADEAKVSAPGTAALSLTTTAIAANDAVDRRTSPHAVAVAPAGAHAPYARTGPVPSSKAAGRQKPEVAANGGNWAIDRATGNIVTDAAELAVTTLIPPINGRLFGSATGTSLSAPWVAHEVAKIATRYPDAGPNLLRALTALSGGYRPRPGDRAPSFHSSAYGVPDASDVLESDGNRVFFTFEGSMTTNSHVVLELPIPEVFARGASTREIRVALAFDPPVRRSRKDYIAGRMEFAFIQRESLEDIRAAYAKQPTKVERDADTALELNKRLGGRQLIPSKTTFYSDTLMRRAFFSRNLGWDADDEDYFLVITHEHSRWTPAQKKSYTEQEFAIAVEICDHGRLNLDLYAEALARLQHRAGARAGGAR